MASQATPEKCCRANKRNPWDALRRFARGLPCNSNMRFNPFALFRAHVQSLVEDEQHNVYNLTLYQHIYSEARVVLRERRDCGTKLSDISAARRDGVDNTGNFHWPSEEVLAHVVVGPRTAGHSGSSSATATGALPQRRIYLELGAGNGLCGLLLAAACPQSSYVVLTDGNSSVVDNLHFNVSNLSLQSNVEVHQVLWHAPESYQCLQTVDEIIGADCLFFDRFHEDLAALLEHFLRRNPNLVVTLVQPRRGNTLDKFVDVVRSMKGTPFDVDVVSDFDATVSEMATRQQSESPDAFDPDIHLPLMVRLRGTHAKTQLK